MIACFRMRSVVCTGIAWCLGLGLIGPVVVSGGSPQQTLQDATRVIQETRQLKMQSIPDSLLANAQAIAIIPNVVKLGFIVGGRHGRGVVMARDINGAWSSPTFIELTGGGIGWQVGVQSTDVVLVFKNRRGVDDLLQGKKFTLGADAAVAAGPVGRQAGAATDEQLRAEVYSYSRSRGLFAGVSLEGTILSVDAAAMAQLAQNGAALQPDMARLAAALQPAPAAPTAPVGLNTPSGLPTIEQSQAAVGQSMQHLSPLLPDVWRQYLGVPPQLLAPNSANLAQTEEILSRYDRVAADPQYESLAGTPEFQATHVALGNLVAQLKESGAIALPAPPQ